MIRKPSAATAKAAPRKGVIAVAPPSFRRERALFKRGVLAGRGAHDEAGSVARWRGRWWLPLSFSIPSGCRRDSTIPKRLTRERRELFEEICATALVSVAVAPPSRIEREQHFARVAVGIGALGAGVAGTRHVFVDGRSRIDVICGGAGSSGATVLSSPSPRRPSLPRCRATG